MKKRQKKKFALIGIVLIILAFFLVPMFMTKPTLNESGFIVPSTGSLSGNSFFSSEKYINIRDMFAFDFVAQSSLQAIFYQKTFESDIYIKPKNFNVVMGINCDVGEATRYFICSDANLKSSCNTDMFDNLWLVEDTYNHLESQNFYIDDLEFHYSYICYDPQGDITGVDLGFEHSFLVDNKCVSELEANGRGIDYETEKFCLDALINIIEDETQEESELEKLRVACLSGDGSWTNEKCTYPPTSSTDEQDCEDDGKLWTGVSCIVKPTTDDSTRTTTTTTTTNDDEEVTDTTTTTKENSVLCKDYELLVDGLRCEFSFANVFTNEGFSQFYDDNQMPMIIGIAVILIVGTILIIGRKK